MSRIIGSGMVANRSQDCSYYAAPDGVSTNSGLSLNRPIRIQDFWALAGPGKTLCLASGTPTNPLRYQGSANMITSELHGAPLGLAGTASAPIKIKALVEGGVLIDGQGARPPLIITTNFTQVEGINACCSSTTVLRMRGGSTGWVLRRVIGWDAKVDTNNNVAHGGGSTFGLMEDCAMFGTGRKMWAPGASDGDNHTLRRVFHAWMGHNFGGPKMGMSLHYHSTEQIIENCIGMWPAQLHQPEWTQDQIHGPYAIDGADKPPNTWLIASLGMYRANDETWMMADSNASAGVLARGSFNYIIDSVMYADSSHTKIRPFSLGNSPSGSTPEEKIFTNGVSIGPRSSVINAEWQTTNFQHGSSVGAVPSLYDRMCKKVVNRVTTDEPLWPWPMNERIKMALSIAGYPSIDVNAEIQGVWGAFPANCTNVSV